jgi:hypothetical protein
VVQGHDGGRPAAQLPEEYKPKILIKMKKSFLFLLALAIITPKAQA